MNAITALLDDYNATVQAIATALRELVLDVMPEANETVTGHKNITYSTDAGTMLGGMVYIAPFKDSVNLGFMDGVDLPDYREMFEGTGKRMRHIKFKSVAAVEEEADYLREMLQKARDLKM